MKMSLIFAALFVCQLTYAQSAKDKATRQVIIDRAELLIKTASAAREDLDREDIIQACERVKEMHKIYPDHLLSIGTHLDIEKGREIKAKNEALNQVVLFHKQTLLCESGNECEYVDSKKLDKILKQTQKSLKTQLKTIKKLDVTNMNSYKYDYEF